MNAEHRQQVLDLLTPHHSFDIVNALAVHHPPSEIENLMANGIPLKTLVPKYKRAIKQLESELKSDNYIYLPIDNNDPRIGEFNLINNLHNLIQHIESNDLNSFENSLRKQILYQVSWGFWDRSNRRVHDVEAIQLNAAIENIEMAEKAITAQEQKLTELYQSISAKMTEMQSFMEQKQRDVDLINSKRDEILGQVSEANQAVINANDLKGQVETAKNSASELKEEAKRHVDEQRDYVKNFQEQSNLLVEELKTKLEDAKKKLGEIKEDHSFVEEKKDYIELKEEEIIKLAAQASDGALGHMFDKRKDDLKKSATTWMWFTIGMTVVLFGWVFVVFYFLSDTTFEPLWLNPLISVIKTVPAFILLAFFARQYTKERNLQEEYAFKASIAMTIMAYADVIDTDSENPHRIEIIKQSIDTVYKIPKITTERMGIGISSKARKEAFDNLNNVTKTLSEAIQNIKK